MVFFFLSKSFPGASFNTVVGWENEELKVRLTAVPEKGKANDALIAFLAKLWKLPKSAFSIESGKTSRHKKLLIHGVSIDMVLHWLDS